MKIQEKPDYLIFAESAKKGEVSDFPDVSRGWGVTIEQTGSKPPMEWMNGAFNRVDKNMLYLLQQGVPEWSESVKYPTNAIIKYNGVLYTAIIENDNAKPSTNTTKWKKTQTEIPIASLDQKGLVKLNSEINSESETDAATPRAVKKTYDLATIANTTATTANNTANAAVKRSGDNMAGELLIKNKRVLVDGDAFRFNGYLNKTNLNSITASQHGVYLQNMNEFATTSNNYPINAAGSLIVTQTGGDGINGCVQIYTDYRSARQFIRTYRDQNNVWSPWVEQITSANLNAYLPPPLPPQVWHNEISQRAANVVYTNTTGQTIFVMISFQHGWSGTAIDMRLFINGMEFYATTGGSGSGSTKNVTMYMPIPAGCTYRVTGGGNLTAWYELK